MRWPWQKRPEIDGLTWQVQQGQLAVERMLDLQRQKAYAEGRQPPEVQKGGKA